MDAPATRLTFFCRCGRQIARQLRRVDPGWVVPEDGEPAVPEGTFAVADEEGYFTPGAFVVRLEAMTVVRYTDVRRIGCCGIDGCDGPNRACECGRAVGTERSDCWTPHGVGLDPAAVLVSDDNGPPLRPDALADEWLAANGHTGFEIAVTMAVGGTIDGLPVLADALEEGGCDDRAVLAHLRSPHPYGRCWLIDRLADGR